MRRPLALPTDVAVDHHEAEGLPRQDQDEQTFERVVQTIWDVGFDRPYLRRPWRSLNIGAHYVWIHTLPKRGRAAPLEATEIINRAETTQEQLPGAEPA